MRKGNYLTENLRSPKTVFTYNKHIVEQRSQMAFDELLQKCIGQLENMSNSHILDGVGELMTAGQKDWARSSLREETISLLKLRLENEK
jgi:hypothetical protein